MQKLLFDVETNGFLAKTDRVKLYRRCFAYDPNSGDVTWRVCLSNRAPVGARVETLNSTGYKSCRLLGKTVTAHQIAFAIMRREIPARIDHRDRDRTNNVWSNLRPVTASQNIANSKTHVDSSTGFKGVTRTSDGRFRARIRVNYALKHLGYFKTAKHAHTAYRVAARKYFGEFANA